MGQCNAQTDRTLPGVVPDQSTARLSKTCTTTKEEPPYADRTSRTLSVIAAIVDPRQRARARAENNSPGN